jgi:hypothetical protein
MANVTQQYRNDVVIVRNCDDGSGKTYETHSGWQIVKLDSRDGEMFEPIDFPTGDVQDNGEKKVTGRVLVENYGFSNVHGGGPGRVSRSV